MKRSEGDPTTVVHRWIKAINAHDANAVAACFDADYRDEAPARRGETVAGSEKVRENFARFFQEMPDLRAELVDAVSDGGTVWMEWRMQGTRRDGSSMEFVGINRFGVHEGRLVWGRIYTELVREAGGIDSQIDRMAKGRPESDG
jgi:hypothetical protein